MGGGNRRRVDSVARAEARRVLVARVTVGALAVAILAAAGGVAFGAWRFATTASALAIREIRWSGLERAQSDDLEALSPVQRGDNIVRADLEAMRAALLGNPWVRRVELRRAAFPPAIEVRITERRATALVDLGGLYLVDREAVPFKRAAAGDGLDLPLVTGLSRDDYVQRRGELEPLLAGALALVDGYEKAGLAEQAQISEVHLDLESGITIYVGEQGTQVRLGQGDLTQKLSRLKRTLAALGADARRVDVVHLDSRTHPSWATVRVAGGVGGPDGVAPLGPKAGGKGPRGL